MRPRGRVFPPTWIVWIVVAVVSTGGIGLAIAGASPARASSDRPLMAGAAEPNSTFCEVLDPFLSTVPAAYYTNVTSLFATLCNQTGFDDLLTDWGSMHEFPSNNGSGTTWQASNFSLDWGEASGQAPSAYFTVNWVGWCSSASVGASNAYCGYEQYWTGYVSNTTLSGPTQEEYPLVTTGLRPLLGYPAGEILLLAGIAVAIGLGVVLVVRHRRRSHPPDPPTPSDPAGATGHSLDSDADRTTRASGTVDAGGANPGRGALDDRR